MSRRVLKRNHRKVRVGDLNSLVKIQDRSIEDPPHGDTEFEEDFSCPDQTWAKVETTAGKEIMNSVGVVVAVTHAVTIRYVEDVDAETWVLLSNGSRLRVMAVEDLEERHEYLRLLCAERGDKDAEASRA